MASNNENIETQTACRSNSTLALLVGAGAGFAIGILMAPKAGHKFRTEIGKAVNGYLDSACSAAEKARSVVAGAVDTGAKDINKAIDQTLAAARTGAKQGHGIVNNVAETLHAVVGK
jgi:gas vesicle protein